MIKGLYRSCRSHMQISLFNPCSKFYFEIMLACANWVYALHAQFQGDLMNETRTCSVLNVNISPKRSCLWELQHKSHLFFSFFFLHKRRCRLSPIYALIIFLQTHLTQSICHITCSSVFLKHKTYFGEKKFRKEIRVQGVNEETFIHVSVSRTF